MKAILVVMSCALLGACAGRPDADRPRILARAQWQAKAPVAEMKRHQVRFLTIHHTATTQKPDRTLAQKIQALQKFSQNPGVLGNGKAKPAWPDVPYHFYIDCHGQIGAGRELEYVGDTNTEYDPTGHALIVLEGNFEEEIPTPEQLVALRQMIVWLSARYHIPAGRVGTHQDYAGTLCPGKNLSALIPELRKAVVSE